MRKTTAGRENLHRSIDASIDDNPTVEFAGLMILVGIVGLMSLFLYWGSL